MFFLNQTISLTKSAVIKSFCICRDFIFFNSLPSQDGYMSDGQVDMVQDAMFDLLAAIKPNAVALVDAFDFPDQVLGSALGRWDGNVYEAIMETARNSTLNKSQVSMELFDVTLPLQCGLYRIHCQSWNTRNGEKVLES